MAPIFPNVEVLQKLNILVCILYAWDHFSSQIDSTIL